MAASETGLMSAGMAVCCGIEQLIAVRQCFEPRYILHLMLGSGLQEEGLDDQAITLFGTEDHRDPAGARGRHARRRSLQKLGLTDIASRFPRERDAVRSVIRLDRVPVAAPHRPPYNRMHPDTHAVRFRALLQQTGRASGQRCRDARPER